MSHNSQQRIRLEAVSKRWGETRAVDAISFFAAPLTSLNPTIGAGFVAAGVELYLRKPKVRDFSTLRHDVTELKGWWRNRVSRTLLVFMLATLGSAAGTWVAGFRIAGALFGSGTA